jgi:hypothetical protein
MTARSKLNIILTIIRLTYQLAALLPLVSLIMVKIMFNFDLAVMILTQIQVDKLRIILMKKGRLAVVVLLNVIIMDLSFRICESLVTTRISKNLMAI